MTPIRDVVDRLQALERPFEARPNQYWFSDRMRYDWRVVQRCLICEVELGLTLELTNDGLVDPDWLWRELFALYDGHRCRIAVATADAARRQELFERTERESVRMTERAVARAASDPELAQRADREAGVLLEWAADLAKQV